MYCPRWTGFRRFHHFSPRADTLTLLIPATSPRATAGSPTGGGMLSSETGFIRLGRKSRAPLVLGMTSAYQLEHGIDGEYPASIGSTVHNGYYAQLESASSRTRTRAKRRPARGGRAGDTGARRRHGNGMENTGKTGEKHGEKGSRDIARGGNRRMTRAGETGAREGRGRF